MPSEFTANSDFDADEKHFQWICPSILKSDSVQYHDTNSFKALNNFTSTKDLSITPIIIKSINAKCHLFLSFLSSLYHNFDIICFTECNVKEGEQAGKYFKNLKTFYSGISNRKAELTLSWLTHSLEMHLHQIREYRKLWQNIFRWLYFKFEEYEKGFQ